MTPRATPPRAAALAARASSSALAALAARASSSALVAAVAARASSSALVAAVAARASSFALVAAVAVVAACSSPPPVVAAAPANGAPPVVAAPPANGAPPVVAAAPANPARPAAAPANGAPPVVAAPVLDAVVAADAPAIAAPVAAAAPDAEPPPALAVVDAPIPWTAEREQLTLEYRRTHSDPGAADLAIVPRVIVLHYTGGGDAAATRAYFAQPRIEASRTQLAAAGAVNVSAHFLVDRDGTIYALQPPTRYARHCIGLDHISIGIENVGDEARWPLTDAQVAADAALVRDLAAKYPITHLLGHFEVMRFRSNAYFVERDPKYRNSKPDPGARFLALVRARVADLHLSGL
ncbi:MAG TPA: peptidoglycan recognition family protein [Kofleriaceae bacterium]